MKVKDVTNYLESIAPLQLQESYDNSGWQVGDYDSEIKRCFSNTRCYSGSCSRSNRAKM